jgi:hypothetical protein
MTEEDAELTENLLAELAMEGHIWLQNTQKTRQNRRPHGVSKQ